jgi:hypothetical protein
MAYGIDDYQPKVLIGAPPPMSVDQSQLYSARGFGQNTALAPQAPQQSTPSAGAPGGNAIPPALQSIIDKISGTTVSPGRKIAALSSLAGNISGIHQQGMKDASEMAKLGVAQAGADKAQDKTIAAGFKQLGITEAGLDRRAAPKMMDAPSRSISQNFADTAPKPKGGSWFSDPNNLDIWKSIFEK